MKICGIIAEYNPFHNGHMRHLIETKAILGDDTAIVCALSGNYVQRGDFAILQKYHRAEIAVRCGVDLVIELPLSACLSSAAGFARGGVALLDALGCIQTLCFGSECGNLSIMERIAAHRMSEKHTKVLLNGLGEGLSYAAAQQQALENIDPDAASVLRFPNNTLGVEYCAALHDMNSLIQPLTVVRKGAAHDAAFSKDRLPSSSFLRALIADNCVEKCQNLMPESAFHILKREIYLGSAPTWLRVCENSIFSHLRRLSPKDLQKFTTSGEGLHNRLYAAVRDNIDFYTACMAAQTRRYPLARIRRTLLRAWLGLPSSSSYLPQYVRVLAIGAKGRHILRLMKSTCSIPVIIKPITEKTLPKPLQPSLADDSLADELYSFAYPNINLHRGGGHFRNTPFCLSK